MKPKLPRWVLPAAGVALGVAALAGGSKRGQKVIREAETAAERILKIGRFSYSSDGSDITRPWAPDWSLAEPELRAKVGRVLSRLTAQGYHPIVYELQRSPARGAEMKRLEVSRLGDRSLHVIGGTSGRTLARAADIIDERTAWSDLGFFDALADAAEAEGLVSGWRWKTFRDGPHIELRTPGVNS